MACVDQSPDAISAAEAVRLRTRDPAEFELALQPWELQCRPRSAGDFRHDITALKSDRFVFYREHYDLAVKLQGLTPEGMLGISIPLEFNQDLNYWGQEYSTSMLVGTLPGGADAILSQGYSHLVALVAIDHLRDLIPADGLERLETAARSHLFQVPRPLLTSFTRWGNRCLDAVGSHPTRFAHRAVIEEVLGQIVQFLLAVSAHLPPHRPMASLGARQRGLFKVFEYLRERIDVSIPVGELCRVGGISERTLQYAFMEEFGVSPSEFMRLRRLHAVKRRLTMASPGDLSVSQAAQEFGFHELGRFAGDYRRLFGVRPSATLRLPKRD